MGYALCMTKPRGVERHMSWHMCENMDLDARIVRIFNTYGPNMQADDGRVVSNFILQALKNEPLTIYGDGKSDRGHFVMLTI